MTLKQGAGSPLWSPDGDYLAFIVHEVSDGESKGRIWVTKKDGSDEHPVTPPDEDCHSPSWSPKGDRLAYVSIGSKEHDRPSICVVGRDGKNAIRLTSGKNIDSDPCWTLGGDKIVFASARGRSQQIYSVSVEGAKETQLTRLEDSVSSPGLSPDGKTLLVTVNQGGAYDLWLITMESGKATRLTEQESTIAISYSQWSPDGKRIALISTDKSSELFDQLYVLELDKHTLTRVTDHKRRAAWPCWSPDSRRILYSHGSGNVSNLACATVDSPRTEDLTSDGKTGGVSSWSVHGLVATDCRHKDEAGICIWKKSEK